MSLPSLPPRLELVVLLAGAVVGYNLTIQILPSQRINLAQLDAQDRRANRNDPQISRPGHALNTSMSVAQSASATGSLAIGSGVCTVPVGGGPALNERFEPC